MVYFGVLLGPRRKLDNRGCCSGHQPASLGVTLLVVVNFNTNLAALEGRARDKEIASAMSMAGLEDMNGNFLPRHKPWLKDGKTYSMLRRGRDLRYSTNYILVTDNRLIHNVPVRDARPNTEHYFVLGCLHGSMPDAHLR